MTTPVEMCRLENYEKSRRAGKSLGPKKKHPMMQQSKQKADLHKSTRLLHETTLARALGSSSRRRHGGRDGGSLDKGLDVFNGARHGDHVRLGRDGRGQRHGEVVRLGGRDDNASRDGDSRREGARWMSMDGCAMGSMAA